MAKGNKKSNSKSNIIVSNDQQYEMTEDKHGIFRFVKEDGTETKRYQMLAITVPEGGNKSKLISEDEALRLIKEYGLELKFKVTQAKQKTSGKITRKKVDSLIKLALEAGVDQEKIEKIMGFSVDETPSKKTKAAKKPAKKTTAPKKAKVGKKTVAVEESEEVDDDVSEEAPAPKKAAKKGKVATSAKKPAKTSKRPSLADLVATEESEEVAEDDAISEEEAPKKSKAPKKTPNKRTSSKRVKKAAEEEEDE